MNFRGIRTRPSTVAPDAARDRLLSTVLRIAALLGAITAVPSVIFAATNAHLLLAVADVAAVVTIAVMALTPSIPYIVRSLALIAFALVLGVVLMPIVGTVGTAYLIGVPVFCAILLGRRAALAGIAVIAVTLLAMLPMMMSGVPSRPESSATASAWLLESVNIVFVATLLALSCASLLRWLTHSMAQQQRAVQSLAEQRIELIAINEHLVIESDRRGAAEESATLLSEALDEAGDSILVANSRGEFYYRSESASRLAEWVVDPSCFEDVGSLVALAGPPAEGGARLGVTLPWTGDLTLVGPAGELRCYETRLVPIRGNVDEVGQVVVVLHDVTQQRANDSRLRRAEKLTGLGTLAGGIAHDFNNLVSTILLLAEDASTASDDPDVLANMELVVEACERAREMVRQLTFFGGDPSPGPTSNPIRDLVDRSVRLVSLAIPPSVELTTRADVDGSVPLSFGQFHQVIENLVRNAVDACQGIVGGHIAIIVQRSDATVGDSAFAIEVTDNGAGIPPENLARLFEPFFTTKGRAGGGLGLSSVYSIVTAVGGDVVATSQIGIGTTFRVLLPAPSEDDHANTSPVASSKPASLTTGRILVVEDEPVIRALAQKTLEGVGFIVHTAVDGIQARATLEDRHFDAVVTDLSMPRMDGWELLALIRQERPTLPVAITSGLGAASHDGDSRDLSPDAWLAKPYTRAQLIDCVRTLIDEAGLWLATAASNDNEPAD